jgi:transposase
MDRTNVARNKKKVAQDPDNVLLTSDEAGFNLLSSCMRTYAPCGQTPVLQQDCKYAHLSVIAAISTTGSIVTDMIDGNFDGPKIVDFLRKLLEAFNKEIHLIWDGAKCHMGQAVKDFLNNDPEAKRLFLYRIPPYSPELNPTEQLWNNVKNVDLKNQFSKNKSELKEKLVKVFENIKEKTDIISAFFRHPKVVFGI